jgi:predicted amidophosphoribosyltransferase
VERIPRALAKMIKRHVDGPVTLVPIPNSHVTGVAAPDFKTLDLAKSVASASEGQFSVVPALVFKKPQIKSRKGGPRSAVHCEGAYRLASDVKGKIVLLDDVCTSGGHIIGAYRKLQALPAREIVLACAFGRSTKEQVHTPIGPREEVLDLSRD